MIGQAAFEHDGHTRPNILASKIAALTLVSAFAITGCASGERDNDPGPGIEQVSEGNEDIDISSLTEKQQGLFKKLDTHHNGALADFNSAAENNQNLLGADGDAFNALTIEVNGRDINCGIARNFAVLPYEFPVGFEEASFDPTSYELSCGGYGSSTQLGLFVPYMGKIQDIAPELTPDGTQPEIVVGAIYQTGEELLGLHRRPDGSETRDSLIDEVYASVDNWQGYGYTPSREEVATIFDTAVKDIYGVDLKISESNAAPAASAEPTPAETTQPAIEPEFETNVSSELGVTVNDEALLPLSVVQSAFEEFPLSDAKMQPYHDKKNDKYVLCDEYLGISECSDIQTRAMYTAARTIDSFYGIGEASKSTDDVQASAVYNLLLQANDPELQAKGGLKTYSFDLLVADVQSQLHRDLSKAKVEKITDRTLEILGISLSRS